MPSVWRSNRNIRGRCRKIRDDERWVGTQEAGKGKSRGKGKKEEEHERAQEEAKEEVNVQMQDPKTEEKQETRKISV